MDALEQVEVDAGVVRDRGLDRIGVRHDHHELGRDGRRSLPRSRRPSAPASPRATPRRGTTRATGSAAPPSRGRSSRGRRASAPSSRRSRPRARRRAAGPGDRGARRPPAPSAWCARSGSRTRPRPGARRDAPRAPRPGCDPPPRGRCPGARPESSGPVCAVTAWRASTRRVGARAPRRRNGRCASRWFVPRGSSSTRCYRPCFPCSAAARASARSLVPMPDAPVTLTPSGPPETVLDREPTDAVDALAAALDTHRVRRATRRGRAPSWRAGRGTSTPGRGSVSSRATMPRPTRASASATTAGSTACGRTAGAARATSAGRTTRTAGSCGRSPACGSVAGTIGEHDEERRCAEFLHQLDPDWDRHDPEALASPA